MIKEFSPVDLQELRGGDNFLQSGFWGLLKSFFGWKPYSFCLNRRPLLVLVRKLPGGVTAAYVPHGPDVGKYGNNPEFVEELGKKIAQILPVKPAFIRFDLPWIIETGKMDRIFAGSELKKAAVDIQPPDTVIVSLKESEDEILRRMKSKTRYNIRLSVKKGVEIHTGGRELLSVWYDLYRETAARDKITIHSREYYNKIFNISESGRVSTPEIVLFTASHGKEIIAGIIVVIYGTRATYLYGASSDTKRNLMPNYALQWEAMKYAKSRGCDEYDFFGIPPENDPSHPMYGLYRFKTGFGGEIVKHPGCWDLPLKPFTYTLYRKAEIARQWYYKKLKKK